MTDLERVIDTYNHLGIELSPEVRDTNIFITLGGQEEHSNKSPKFCGYLFFYSYMKFDLDGKFICQSFLE